MHVNALRYLVAVADEGHFGRAATRLHVAQPSVSQAIRRLEGQFGVQLLDRSGGRVLPTEAGERVLVDVRAALGHLDRALEGAVTARLRLTCTSFAGLWTIPTLLAPYGEAHPDVEISVSELDVPLQPPTLLDGSIDVAVGEPLPAHDGLVSFVLREDPCAVWMAEHHPLARHDAVPLAALAGVPMMVGDPAVNPTYRAWVLGQMERAGVEPTLAPSVSDTPSAFREILAGRCVSLTCDMLAPGAMPGLAVRPVADPITWSWTVTHTASPPPAARVFLAWAANL